MKTFQQFLFESPKHIHQNYRVNALKSYTSNSNGINTSLRKSKGNHPPDKKIHAIDSYTSTPSTKDHTLHRGVHHKDAKHFEVGKTIVKHDYTSTSHSKESAHWFTTPNKHGETHMMKIHAPKGTKGHDVHPHHASPEQNDHEHIPHRGTHFHIHDHTYDHESKIHTWHAKVVKQ